MTDLLLNVDFTPCERPGRKEPGNPKHRRFLRRRRALEQRGVLKQKQLPVVQPPAGRGSLKKPGRRGKGLGAAGGHQEKRNPQPKPCRKANGATSVTRPGAAAQNSSASSNRTGLPLKIKAKPRGAAKSKGSPPAFPPQPPKLVAIDCEMVGTGPGGRTSDLARCSIVSYNGDVMYDQYIRPVAPIVDYRTRWSGIRRHHMANAVPFSKAQREILRILAGKIVVGHAVSNDFKALKYFHPKALTRDTSRIPLLNRKGGFPENVSISLKRLTKQLLHKDIQVGKTGHCSVEDARATMELYKVVETEWEQHLMLNPEQD
ncbi:interferon-stimulated 20 kDa exonuclease-like 2 [Falco naumanni]|uniref:interferon-stimulated 20 kDa exonuclease-like 2 n=1 Tax=Falco naumanni TaxID=148594 RepID=UPI001ADE1F50|nr:interferon-stimulated 20 kDa exonuclease-like 2 [Falco naumanni]XP_040433945.1 interferon-stimulated 20 kDa exonuclease-like 2 [Falco naumanni]